jgi:hypothetical protein
MLEARAILGRELQLEVHRIRYGASRSRHEDVLWLDFVAPHCHLAVDDDGHMRSQENQCP